MFYILNVYCILTLNVLNVTCVWMLRVYRCYTCIWMLRVYRCCVVIDVGLNIKPEPHHFSPGGITTSHLAVLRLLPGGVRMAEFLPVGIEYYPPTAYYSIASIDQCIGH